MKKKIRDQLELLQSEESIESILNLIKTFLEKIKDINLESLKEMDEDKENKDINQICIKLINKHTKQFVLQDIPGHFWTQVYQPSSSALTQLCGLYYFTQSCQRDEKSRLLNHNFDSLIKAFKLGSPLGAYHAAMRFIGTINDLIKTLSSHEQKQVDDSILKYISDYSKFFYSHLTPGFLLIGQINLLVCSYFYKTNRFNDFLYYAHHAFIFFKIANRVTSFSSKQIFNFYGKKTIEEALKVKNKVLFDNSSYSSIAELISKQRAKINEYQKLNDDHIDEECSQIMTSLTCAGYI